MPVHLHPTIDIAASPEEVWPVLADFASYPAWNPFIRSAAGSLAVGERLSIRVQPPEGKAMRFRPTVRVVREARELAWLGRLLVPGLFDGEHRFALEPTATGSRFVHEERFTGVLVPFFRDLRQRYLPAFEQMNDALKRRVEAGSAAVAA